MMNDEFHLHFSSDNSKYQTNTSTNFKYLMNAPANVNKEYHVDLLSTNFKNEFLPDKIFDFYFIYNLYDDNAIVPNEIKVYLNGDCLNAKDIYRKFISELNALTDPVGNAIMEAKENDDVLGFRYERKNLQNF